MTVPRCLTKRFVVLSTSVVCSEVEVGAEELEDLEMTVLRCPTKRIVVAITSILCGEVEVGAEELDDWD